MPVPPSSDQRIPRLIEAAEEMKEGRYRVEVPVTPPDDLGRLGATLKELAETLEARYRQIEELGAITASVNSGLLLDDVLEKIYSDFREHIPYDRIGCSLIDADGKRVRARWAKASYPGVRVMKGYSAPLAGSSLETIFRTGRPRILNDLAEYLRTKPGSESTRLIVAEGIRSSLTCPLVANGVPVGFLFFSSTRPGTYADAHVEIYQRIAQQISVIVEKGRLVSQLADQKAEIERQNDELRRLGELKNRFLGMVAHDLRNPIGNVQAIAELLLDPETEVSEAERRSFLEDVLGQTRYMLPLLEDLLDVTEIDSARLVLHKERVNVVTFLSDCVARHALLAEPKGTRVVLGEATPGYVEADPVRLRQVLDNLVSNAVKFSPPGSNVRIEASKLETGWRIAVHDEGPGLTDQDRQRLFLEFARLSARPTGDEKSTGLGLAISRRIVEAHGGSIGADSSPGRSSTFWFSLPL